MMALNRHLYPISDGLVRVLDVAFWDIPGEAAALGIADLLGVCRDRVPSYRLEVHTLHSPLLDIANIHVACSIRNCEIVESHHPMFRFALKHAPLDIDSDGCQRLPTGVGLDWDWIDNHTTTVLAGEVD